MTKTTVDFETVIIENPDSKNLVFGQSHFIKTVEDIHEAMVSSVPGIQFGVAFCEASGPRLIRSSGTSGKMIALAEKNAQTVGCGHTFFLFLDNVFPINVNNAVKLIPQVVNIFCATANQVTVVVAKTEQGRGVMGVIDGGSPLGIENADNKKKRIEFLRSIGYKLQ